MIGRADAICKRLNASLLASERNRPEGKQPGAGSVVQSVSHNAALERLAVASLVRLKPPTSLARDWRQMLAYRRTLIDELHTLASDVKTNNKRAVQALAVSKLRVHEKLLQLAGRDGFRDCAHVGSDPSTPSRPQSQPPPSDRRRAPVSRDAIGGKQSLGRRG